jgi:DNA helicase-2/ATP-dependent DNA helicase PcrA
MAIEHAPELEGVTIASLHAAKGLEWDAVFLAGLTDGNLPIIHAQTDEDIEEERRLLYVGVTRAREHLFLSWSLARAPGGRRTRRPSRFLDGLPAASRPGRARPQVTADQPVDEALLDRLREWRRATAKLAGVPAFVVFSDDTLRRIAARRPVTPADLAGLPGVGPAKLARYGAAVADVCASAGVETGT